MIKLSTWNYKNIGKEASHPEKKIAYTKERRMKWYLFLEIKSLAWNS